MILVGNQRGGAKGLALHLLKEENEHVQVHEVRGFASDDLMDALNEAHAVSRGTKCKQFLFSLSLNPPQREQVEIAAFESAIEQAEERLGLAGQPRAIVFHEKEGRRHAHVVWSRVWADEMKAVQLSFYKRSLNTLSRELYLEHGWKMPHGLADPALRDPRNFTLAEWQQARRVGKDARAIKTAFQDAWAVSDSKAAFVCALRERGYQLARGDRRGFVGVDHHGEVYSIPRQAGVKTKEVRKRLGDEAELPSVEQVKAQIAQAMLPVMEQFKQVLDAKSQDDQHEFEKRRLALIERQRTERKDLQTQQEQRLKLANQTRQARYRHGLKGVWDTLRGENRRIRKHNEREAKGGMKRDSKEKDALVFRHLEQRKRLSIFRLDLRRDYGRQRLGLERDTRRYKDLRGEESSLSQAHNPRRNSGPDYSR